MKTCVDFADVGDSFVRGVLPFFVQFPQKLDELFECVDGQGNRA